MYYTPASKINNFNDYNILSTSKAQNNYTNNINQTSRSKKFHYANSPQKDRYQYGMFSRRYLGQNTSNISGHGTGNNLNRSSRMSQHNNTTMNMGAGLLNTQQLFSQQMIFLISDQQNNIRYFKERIDSDRQKIHREFENIKQKLNHIVDDLKISFQAQLDKAYKDFINKYRQFKQRMQELRDVRKILLQQNIQTQAPPIQYLHQLNTSRNVTISNRDLLNEIQKDAKLFRNHRLFTHISQVQRQKIEPAKRITSELIALGGIDKQYYLEGQTRNLLLRLVSIFEREVQQVYGDILDNYVISADRIIQIYNQTKQQNTMILQGLNEDNKSFVADQNNPSRQNFKSLDPKVLGKQTASYNNRLGNEQNISQQYGLPSGKKVSQSPPKRPSSQSNDYLSVGFRQNNLIQKDDPRKYSEHTNKNRERPTSDWKSDGGLSNNLTDNKTLFAKGSPRSKTVSKSIGISQQTFVTEWIQQIKLKEIATIQTYQHQDALLCCVFACRGRFLVTGGKDRSVRVYDTNNGKLITTLQGHYASICSMGNHQAGHQGHGLVSSGGDHGCGSLILWDTRTWTIHSKVQQAHSAALTSIVDLQDGIHLATGSYDKKILIYNYLSSAVVYTLTSNLSSISCMSLTSDGERLITSGLDSSLSVWRIGKKGDDIYIELERTFSNSIGLICSLRTLRLKPDLCIAGTKQGKLQIINIHSGQTIKKLAVSGGSLIQLVLFERRTKPDYPLALTCSPRQKSLVLTKTQTGINTFLDVKGRLNIDFGCGIGPKIILSENGYMAILSQSSSTKQVNLYKINVL